MTRSSACTTSSSRRPKVGPYKIIHDHQTGRTEIWHATDLVLLAGRPGGLSALDAAKALFDTNTPSLGEKEKAPAGFKPLSVPAPSS